MKTEKLSRYMGHAKEAKLYHDIQYFNIGLSTDVNAFIHGNTITGRGSSCTT
jgi:hypothetical protein